MKSPQVKSENVRSKEEPEALETQISWVASDWLKWYLRNDMVPMNLNLPTNLCMCMKLIPKIFPTDSAKQMRILSVTDEETKEKLFSVARLESP